MIEQVEQVRRQTKQRVFGGSVHAPDKLLSVFVPTTEVIRKGKAGKPDEFGKMVKIQQLDAAIATGSPLLPRPPSRVARRIARD